MTLPQKFSKKEYDKTLYNSTRWREVSRSFLTRNPLCLHCKQNNKITPSSETDHITPHKGNLKLFWDKDNWQPLCKVCHSLKTASETRSISKYPRVRIKPTCKVTIISTPYCVDYASYIYKHSNGSPYISIVQPDTAQPLEYIQFTNALNDMHTIPTHVHAYVVIQEPLAKVRQHYVNQLCAECIVIQHDSMDPNAIKFYNKFVGSLDDKIVYI